MTASSSVRKRSGMLADSTGGGDGDAPPCSVECCPEKRDTTGCGAPAPLHSAAAPNWRSVVSSALSGMLLSNPTRSTSSSSLTGHPPRGRSSRLCRRRPIRVILLTSQTKLRASNSSRGACRLERLLEIGNDVVDMLDADGKPDHLRLHAGALEFFRRQLAMRGGGGMAGERFGVADVHQPLEELQRIVEALARLEAALDAEGQERAAAARSDICSPAHAGSCAARPMTWHHATCGWRHRKSATRVGILDMALHPQRQGLGALQQQKGAQRRQHRAGVALADGAAARDIGACGHIARCRRRRDRQASGSVSMGKRVGMRAQGKLPLSTMAPPMVVPWPPKNFVSEWTTISAPNWIGLSRIGRRHRVVDDQRHAVAVRDVRQRFDVGDVAAGIADAFAIDGAGVARRSASRCPSASSLAAKRTSMPCLRKTVFEERVGRAIELRQWTRCWCPLPRC